MEKRIFKITLVLFLLAVRPAEAAEKMFGYYWNYDNPKEMSTYANVMILPNTYQLNVVSPYGIKGILELGYLWDASKPKPWPLKSDWQTIFDQRWNGSADGGAYPPMSGRVNETAGLYVVDEPEMNVNYYDYVMVTNYIRSKTNTPIVMVTTYEGPGIMEDASKPHPDVSTSWIDGNGLLKIPPMVDILGFDEYNCGGTKTCFGGLTMTQKWEILSRWANRTGKKMMIVGDGAVEISQVGTTSLLAWESTKIIQANEAITWCKSRAECNGMVVFLWKYGGWYGSSEMPNLQNTFKNLNLAGIIPSPTPIPPTATPIPAITGDANGDRHVTLADFMVWRKEFLSGVGIKSDFSGDGKVSLMDFGIWRREFLKSL